ncbi:MAG: methyltransferase domain-containing protein [Bacteroidetes bacterium]|nr:methyltransferase domain-containing protein [Bacteroidota bacterium]
MALNIPPHRIVISLDYETWHPSIPAGKKIDWYETVINPTNRLLEICNRYNAKLTIFFEIGEYYWLKKYRPETATAIENQLKEAIATGHDVQLHIHTSWLPETGANYNPTTDTWFWDNRYQKLHDYPFGIEDLLRRCKNDLESLFQPINPNYKVTTFRAGAYQIQPSKKIVDALLAVGIEADSSVWKGGYQPDRGNDFRAAWSGQPYFASSYNINYYAPPAEHNLLEIPISTSRVFPRIFGVPIPIVKRVKRWFFDEQSFEQMIGIYNSISKENTFNLFKISFSKSFPKLQKLLVKIGYHAGRKVSFAAKLIPLFLPSSHDNLFYDNIFVMIGHSKSIIDFEGFEKLLSILADKSNIIFNTISEINSIIRSAENEKKISIDDDLEFQVEVEYDAIIGDARNDSISGWLQQKIPLDRKNVLDLGCGSGYWTKAIKDRLIAPERVVGLDFGDAFLEKARRVYGAEVVKGDFHHLPFDDNSFDAIYADNTIEHSFSPHRVLEECYRVLKKGGILAMCVPPDARNPNYITPNHNWRMDSDEIKLRFEEIGFENISIEEINAVKSWGERPYLPSNNTSTYVTAWKQYNEIKRIREVAQFCYTVITPEKDNPAKDGEQIINDGYAWCGGYTRAAKYLLEKENFNSRIVTFFLEGLPFGRGKKGSDTHTVLEIWLPIMKKWIICDAMAGVVYPYSIRELIAKPELADQTLEEIHFKFDERWIKRNYEWYSTSKAYKLITRVKYPRVWVSNLINFWQKLQKQT